MMYERNGENSPMISSRKGRQNTSSSIEDRFIVKRKSESFEIVDAVESSIVEKNMLDNYSPVSSHVASKEV